MDLPLAESHSVLIRETPVSALPVEVLALIFVYTQRSIKTVHSSRRSSPASDVDTEESSLCSALSLSANMEITISHVCSHWRTVALNYPRLWVNIHLTPHTTPGELSAYVKRSKDCPVNVNLHLGDSDIGSLEAELLITIVQRWRKLVVEFHGQIRSDMFLAHLHRLEAPSLAHFSVNVNAHHHLELMSRSMNDPLPQIFAGGTPALSFLRLGCHAMSFYRPPLTTITTLHLDQTSHLPISYALFRRLVTSSPLLSNLSIYGDMIDADRWPSGSTIELPALRSLRIYGRSGFIYCGLLLSISAPNLESLILKGVLHHDLDELCDSPQMPKFPALQSLTFCDFECTDSTYRRLFHAFPAITHFTTLHSSRSTPRVVRLIGGKGFNAGLASTSEVHPPWPELHTLTLLFNFDDETPIIRMVNARRRLKYPLTKLRLGAMRGQYDRTRRLSHLLQEHVQVETFDETDPWPVDLQDVDEEDNLF